MEKWVADRHEIFCDDGLVCECSNGARAAQIVREHNAHALLVDALRNLLHTRGKGCNCVNVKKVVPDAQCDECVAKAAIAAAEGGE
jgi:hypothetical protein